VQELHIPAFQPSKNGMAVVRVAMDAPRGIGLADGRKRNSVFPPAEAYRITSIETMAARREAAMRASTHRYVAPGVESEQCTEPVGE
jgi:hypothetical protein